MKRKLILLGVILCTYRAINAQQMTLQDCISLAKSNNAQVQASKIDRSILDSKIKEVKTAILPQVGVSLDYKYLIQIPGQVVPASLAGGPPDEFTTLAFGLPTNLNNSISATQILFSPQYKTALELVKTSTEASDLGIKKAEKDVAYQVSVAYFNIQILKKQINFLDENLSSLQKLQSITQALKDNQLAKGTDVDRIVLNKQNLEFQKENLSSNIEQLYSLLNFLMGKPQGSDLQIVDIDNNITAAQALGSQATDRVELQLLGVQSRINYLEQKGFKKEFLPSVVAYANYSQNGVANSDNLFWIPSSMIGFQLKWNVFDGFARKQKIQTKQVELQKLNLQTNQLNQSIQMELNNAKRSYLVQQSQIKNYQNQIDLANKIFESTQIQYKEGIVAMNEVIQSENSKNEAQNNYINSLLKLKTSELEIMKALGDY
ncbi:MAG: TolC family protein [Leadbetterella sp.]